MVEAGSTRSESATSLGLLAAGTTVASVGVLTLLGWVLDTPVLATWKAGTVPMAPASAALLAMFGTALGLCARHPPHAGAIRLATLFGWVGAAAALLLLALRLMSVYDSAEHFGLPIAGAFGAAPIGHVSPVTAFCFVLANVSLLASQSPGTVGPRRGWLAWGAAGLLSLTGFTLLLAYVVGTPLLAGEALIPPALNTSLTLLVAGLALVVIADRSTRPPAVPSGADALRLRPYALAFIAFAAGTVAVAYDYYHTTERKFRTEVEDQLLAVSELKTSELVQWRNERLGDAILIRGVSMTAAVRRLLATPRSP